MNERRITAEARNNMGESYVVTKFLAGLACFGITGEEENMIRRFGDKEIRSRMGVHSCIPVEVLRILSGTTSYVLKVRQQAVNLLIRVMATDERVREVMETVGKGEVEVRQNWIEYVKRVLRRYGMKTPEKLMEKGVVTRENARKISRNITQHMANVEFREMKIKCMGMKRGGWIDVRGCERGVVNESISGGTTKAEIKGTIVSMEIQSGSYLTSELKGKKVPCMICNGKGIEIDKKLGIATMTQEGKERSMDSVIHVLNCEGSGKLRDLKEKIRKELPEHHALKKEGPHEKWAQFVINPASNKLGDMRISVRKIRQEKEEEKKERKKEERKRKKREEDRGKHRDQRGQGETNEKERKMEEINEVVNEIIRRAVIREKEETDGGKEKEKDEKKKTEEQGKGTWVDEEKVAKNIRELCRIYLKEMHEMRDERTRQSQVVKKWKEMMEKKKREDKQVFHKDRRTYLLGEVPR